MGKSVTLDVDAVDIDDDIFEGDGFQGHHLLDEDITHCFFRPSGQSAKTKHFESIPDQSVSNTQERYRRGCETDEANLRRSKYNSKSTIKLPLRKLSMELRRNASASGLQ